ncbi:Kinesin light chain 1 [Purpureocillium lavendulum]|uniref:Kinesin light chain 1 n=1 Tax=Purpureocillium lavendulum TaxID=1247861 RepID=A0AB34FGM7_9HYPO|nr:Kinesin light chain 1 [Purpureocillium lavendulum]
MINDTKKQWEEFKKLPNMKRILSFGGWAYSTEPATYNIIRSAILENRDVFATNVAQFVNDEGIDGVDIDWEYPGAPDIYVNGQPIGQKRDGTDYLKFLMVLKKKLGPGKSLSIAAPASYWYLKAFPIDRIAAVIDYIVYMTYDLHGQWDYGNKTNSINVTAWDEVNLDLNRLCKFACKYGYCPMDICTTELSENDNQADYDPNYNDDPYSDPKLQNQQLCQIYKDPSCDNWLVNEIAQEIIDAMPIIAQIGCYILMSSLKFVLDVGAQFIPGAGRAIDAGLVPDDIKEIFDILTQVGDGLSSFRKPKNIPKGSDDGLRDNGCWPKDIAVGDPGFALLSLDDWQHRSSGAVSSRNNENPNLPPSITLAELILLKIVKETIGMERETTDGIQELLREAQLRAEAAERRFEEERRQREVAEQQREAAEQQREAAEQQQRRERQQREAAEQQREAAEQQREAAEQQREEAEQAQRHERQQREAAEQQTQPTTLHEYLDACHRSVFTKLRVEHNPDLLSRGSLTNPQSKRCPTSLRQWPEFLEQQRRIFGILLDTFPRDSDRLFESEHFLATMGARIGGRSIADEKVLEFFLHNAVEDPVRNIVNQLVNIPDVRQAFDLGDGIVFENHPHALSETAEEVIDRQPRTVPPSTPGHGENLKKLQADQICIYRSDDAQGGRTRAFICEYKPPHKLTAQHLHVGLRVTDIYKEVVNRKTIPTSEDPVARFAYHAERLTASAITQTYHYMIEGGLEYSLLTTGEAIVFLKIDWDEPETLCYHLAVPSVEVAAQTKDAHLCTAVAQYLAFTLLAIDGLGTRSHGQDERNRVTAKLNKWEVSFDLTYRSIPAEDRSFLSDSSPGYQPPTYGNLEETLDRGITPLGQCGARGVLFQVTLLAYGYTFVSKGTIQAFISDLEHEAAVYRRLDDLQGVHVPVFLGAIDLRSMSKTYYFDHRVYIVHLTFMAWGGESLYEAQGVVHTTEEQVKGSLRAIHQHGVIHDDVRAENILLCRETNGVMMIDFERAVLLEPPRLPLARMAPNKRLMQDAPGKRKRHKSGRMTKRFSEDMVMASGLFVASR